MAHDEVVIAAQQPMHGQCLNCSTPLTGEFCAQCGQRATEHVLSLRELFHELLEVLFHADSRLWRTLRLMLTRPGEVTAEFVRGRRQRYTPPLRTYLVISVLFFFIVSVYSALDTQPPHTAPVVATGMASSDKADDPCSVEKIKISSKLSWLMPHIVATCREIAADSGRHFATSVLHNAPKAMFVFLPLISLFAALLYIGSRRHFVEHLVFFVHHHTVAFLVWTAFILVNAALRIFGTPIAEGWLITAVIFYLPVYLYLGMRRFYGQSRYITALKFALLTALYLVCVFAISIVAVVATALTL